MMLVDKILPFEMDAQEGKLLCWAAIAVSVKRFYTPRFSVSQIDFARSVHGDNFDQVCSPLKAMAHIGLDYIETIGILPKEVLLQHMENGNPILACMRYFIGWHLVVIHGVTTKGEILIADPMHGQSSYNYLDFVRAYRVHYQWTQSYHLPL